jgi:hypothetical protein
VFVLSDGYSSSGAELTAALLRAEEEGVDVIGLCVGMETSLVSKVYRRWIAVALPSVLPDAFRAFFEQDTLGVSPSAVSSRDNEDWLRHRMRIGGGASTLDEVFSTASLNKAFPNLSTLLQVCRSHRCKDSHSLTLTRSHSRRRTQPSYTARDRPSGAGSLQWFLQPLLPYPEALPATALAAPLFYFCTSCIACAGVCLQEERELKLTEGSGIGTMTLDLCFVLDITGSMQPYLASVKGILERVGLDISTAISEAYPNLALCIRFACLGYRDVDDSPQFENCPFAHRPSTVASRHAVLKQNHEDAARVTAHVRPTRSWASL